MTDPVRIGDRYEVLRPLGRGAFGRTLLALDLKLRREVAVKILHPEKGEGSAGAASSLKAYELFEREAAVLRELRHPGVPAVHASFRAVWEGSESAILIMEYIEGASLADVIVERRHLAPEVVLHLFFEVLGVLDYLHTRVPPVLHRDIKPANLIVRPDGSPALVDFGAVRNVFRSPDESGSTVVGTYGYMPYEQYMGQASPASDLFALGATFLHLVTGRAPPEFLSDAGRLEVPALLPCGEPLRGVLTRLLAPASADRFQSAREVRAALVAVHGSSAAPGTSLTRVSPGSEPDTALPARFRSPAIVLAPVPRALTGETAELYHRVIYSPWQLMNTTTRGPEEHGFTDLLLLIFFSVVTIGILPAIFYSQYRARKKRFKPFITDGLPATARVLDMADEKIGFDEKLIRVRYEFEADGRLHRGADQVLPAIAERWDRDDPIQVLYLPDRGYDSVIISTS
jgi:serine/threonine protein kinase